MSTGSEAPATNGTSSGDANGVVSASIGGLDIVGTHIREERLRQKIGVRELARRVGVSASLISQVELGRASPSVGTLYAIVNELGLSLDELFFQQSHGERGPKASRKRAVGGARDEPPEAQEPNLRPLVPESQTAEPSTSEHPRQHGDEWSAAQSALDVPSARNVHPVVRRGAGNRIQLATGVRWERLAPPTPQDIDFLEVTYQPGGESCPPDSLMRHSGHEYGHVISGHMGVTVGFDTYELGPGDSVSFASTLPHRLFTIGEQAVDAIWVVVGRHGEA